MTRRDVDVLANGLCSRTQGWLVISNCFRAYVIIHLKLTDWDISKISELRGLHTLIKQKSFVCEVMEDELPFPKNNVDKYGVNDFYSIFISNLCS